MTTTPRALAQDFDMPDPESRRIATQQISRLRGPEATSLLLRALGDSDWRVRKEAANIAPGVEPRKDVIVALVHALSERENIGLRNAAVQALVEIGADAVEPAAEALGHMDADGRKLAVEILGGISDPRGVDALLRAVVDKDPNVRATAAEALGNARAAGEQPRPEAIQALTRALSEDVTLVKLAALDALVRLEGNVPWSTFEPFMNDPVLGRYAIAAAGRSDDDAALFALADAAGDASAITAKDAIVALADQLAARPKDERVLALVRDRVAASSRALRTARRLAADAADSRTRGAAFVVLGLLGNTDDVPLLVAGLEDEEVAPRAELALHLFGGEAIAPALEAGRESIAPVRAATLSLIPMMSDRPPPFALATLREALDDPNAEVLVAALTALAASGGDEDLATLASHATNPDPRIAGTACSALKTLAPRHPAAARRLVDEMDVAGPRAVVGCVLIGAVAEERADPNEARPSDVVYLRSALDHGDVRARRAAVDALASLGDEGASDVVVFALADEEEDVVLAAVRALGRLHKLKVGECIEHPSPEVRRVAAELLGADGNPTAQASLRSRLERETEPRVREAIAEALSAHTLLPGDGT